MSIAPGILPQMDFVKVPNALRWIRDLYEDESRWTRGQMFRDADDHPSGQDEACKVCLMGAIFLSSRDAETRLELLMAIRETEECSRSHPASVLLLNDKGGLFAVRRALDEAIANHPQEI